VPPSSTAQYEQRSLAGFAIRGAAGDNTTSVTGPSNVVRAARGKSSHSPILFVRRLLEHDMVFYGWHGSPERAWYVHVTLLPSSPAPVNEWLVVCNL
jgi:hypothetical protein